MALGSEPVLSVVDGLATITGELEHSTAPRVASWLQSRPADPLHLDLSGVTFIDSAGLGILVVARRSNPTMRIAAANPTVMRLLEITGLVDFFSDEERSGPGTA